MLRIAVDARCVGPRPSGIGHYTEELLRHLVPMADDVELLVLRHPSAREPIVRHERVRELRFPGETKGVLTVLGLGLRHGFADCDLYHSPGDLVPLGLRCPWVVTMHDLMWVEAPHLASAFLPVRLANGLWYRAAFAHAVRGARAVIAISQATAAAIARVYPEHAHKTRVVRHGIDRVRYSAERAGPRSLLDAHVPPGRAYSLIVGQGSPYKNHPGMVRAFLEAMRAQPEHRLVLVRRFSRFDREMRRLLVRPDVQGRVIVLPSVSDDVLLALFRHARMLLFASRYEGFGLPALEAMALGTPVLGSTAPAVLEVTGEAALHADPEDHRDLVEKMRALDQDEALRARLVAAGTARAAELTWERCARQTLEIYRASCR
ncbi:MAG: glycosyltransferase family 4 protein [Deltaproteobacteria bacterium]|nr:glycosyltransferase family 4 protein [Deltaproteobacteria bacterium]